MCTSQASGPAFAAATFVTTPKDSFLTTQVGSVNDLVYEINSNAAVRQRYSELYHLPVSTVGSYFKQNLKLVRLQQKYTTSVYCVRPNGSFYVVHKTLHAGNRVFALGTGRPVLQYECGNPLTSALPVAGPILAAAPKRVVKKKTAAYVAAVTPLQNVVTPFERVSPYQATIASNDVAVPAAFSPPANFDVPVAFSGSALSNSVTPFLAALPLITAIGSSSGGGTSSVAPAPEAGTDVAWILGGLFVFGATVVGRRKKTDREAA